MIKNWINPFISFRARILIFVTIIVLTAIAAIYYINRHLEERIAGLVAEHIKAISVSVDLAQSSFPTGEYIHELLQEDGRITVGMEESHIIHKIIVVDADDRVIDSAESGDKGKSREEALGSLDLSNPAKTSPVTAAKGVIRNWLFLIRSKQIEGNGVSSLLFPRICSARSCAKNRGNV